MTSPAQSAVQNLLPVQAYFDAQDNFIEFIGQNKPFYATANPSQSGLNITSSTINSTTIGALVPSTGNFTNISAITGTVSTTPSAATDIANKQYVDYALLGISWKAPAKAATTTNITLSGPQTIDTVSVVAGDTVLVKDQTNPAQNGIYFVQTGAWTYATGSTTWAQYIGAVIYIVSGGQATAAFYTTAQPGGTLGVTAMNWYNLSFSSSYTAGTGLTLTGTQFSITNTGVSAATYGSASNVPVIAFNAQGQATSVTNTAISIPNTQVTGLGTLSTQNASSVAITGGTINGTTIGATTASTGAFTTLGGTTITASTQFSGAGTGLTGTATSLSIGGNAATATSSTSATTATNLAGGATGSLPYQSGAGATTFLAAGSNGQVLTLAGGVPSWAAGASGTVTSVTGTGTVSGISLSGTVTSSGSLTLGGSLDLSSPPVIGNTLAAAITGTTITATTSFVGSNFNAAGSGGGSLKTNTGNACLQWGGGGGTNVTIDGAINMNGANSAISLAPTGTGTVTINPATASAMNNVAIGGTTPLAGTFTDFRVNNTISLAGSTGTAGYVLTSNGASAPTWQANASGLTITDDTTTNATRYLTFTSVSTGSITGADVSSTKLAFNPSTGALTATSFNGAGAFTTLSANSTTTISGDSTFSATATFNGSTSTLAAVFANAAETTTIAATAATGTINYDVTTQSVIYYTSNASANWTVNFRASSGTSLNTAMATGQSVTVVFLVTQGSTAYYNNAITIDGTSVTPKYQGGSAWTVGNASGIDAYSYTIVKTGSAAFTVFAAQTQFK
jgi:hypothetical protein